MLGRCSRGRAETAGKLFQTKQGQLSVKVAEQHERVSVKVKEKQESLGQGKREAGKLAQAGNKGAGKAKQSGRVRPTQSGLQRSCAAPDGALTE